MRGQRLIYRPGLRVDLEDFEVPAPGPGQLLLAVTRSQVSAGSELNALRAIDAAGGAPQGSDAPGSSAPGRQMGYTTVGRVQAVGPGGEGFREGDRVLAFGNHASHVLAELNPREVWRSVPDRLPEGVTDEQACFAVLGDVALHGVRRAALQIDESVAVFGAGVVGQLTLQLARLSGAYPTVAVDLDPARLELARALGATHTVDASAQDAVQGVQGATGGLGADTVFHCSANAQLLQTTLSAAAPRGTVVLTGSAPGTAEIRLQPELLRRELTVVGSYETGLLTPHPYWPWTRQRNRGVCYRLIASGQLRVDPLLSHVAPPGEAQALYRMIAAGSGGWMSVEFAWA
jgi:threonine dehydrogenase-like Zn-dependent dehydrogenase